MSMRQELKDMVRLVAYDSTGRQVLDECLPVSDYYEGLHPIIDDDDFRRSRGIARLSGIIFDTDGSVSQQFEVRYDEAGAFRCGGAKFADGTITDDWEKLHDAA